MTTPREDMNSVGHTAADFAFEQIAKRGGFIPFAVVIDRDHKLRFVALGEDQIDDNGSEDVAKYHRILHADAAKGDYVATAIASDVRVQLEETGEVTDAIRLEVEHINAEPMTCILPYRKMETGVEQHIDPFFVKGKRSVFS